MSTRLVLSTLLNMFLAMLLIASSQPAFAYIDPGSGSAIMSAVVGFFVALGLAVKTYWYKLKGIFSRKNINQDTAEDDSSGGGAA